MNTLAIPTILVIDDEPGICRVLKRMLEPNGYYVLTAETGEEAMMLVRTHPEPIDLVLTDLLLPDFNGYQLYQRLTDGHPERRVLFMSGYPGDVLDLKLFAGLPGGYLCKPFNSGELLRKVNAALTGEAARLPAHSLAA